MLQRHEIDASCLAFLAMSSLPPFCFSLFLCPGDFREFCLSRFNSCLSSSVNTTHPSLSILALSCPRCGVASILSLLCPPLSPPSPHPQHLSQALLPVGQVYLFSAMELRKAFSQHCCSFFCLGRQDTSGEQRFYSSHVFSTLVAPPPSRSPSAISTKRSSLSVKCYYFVWQHTCPFCHFG